MESISRSKHVHHCNQEQTRHITSCFTKKTEVKNENELCKIIKGYFGSDNKTEQDLLNRDIKNTCDKLTRPVCTNTLAHFHSSLKDTTLCQSKQQTNYPTPALLKIILPKSPVIIFNKKLKTRLSFKININTKINKVKINSLHNKKHVADALFFVNLTRKTIYLDHLSISPNYKEYNVDTAIIKIIKIICLTNNFNSIRVELTKQLDSNKSDPIDIENFYMKNIFRLTKNDSTETSGLWPPFLSARSWCQSINSLGPLSRSQIDAKLIHIDINNQNHLCSLD